MSFCCATARTMSVPQPVPLAHGPEGLHGALVDGELGVRDHPLGSISMRVPSPSHSGHMPWGELKENICGVELREGDPAIDAGRGARENPLLEAPSATTSPARRAQGRLHGFVQPLAGRLGD